MNSGEQEPHVRPPAQPPPRPFSTGVLTFVGSILLIAIAFSVGLSYLLEKHWSHRAMTASASAGELLKPSMFHVTAISPGASHVATVNGTPVEEGGTVTVSTPSGPVQARVTRIEDGLVRFVYGDEQIEVSPDAGAASPGPP